MKITKEWGLKIGIVLMAALWLSLVAASWADADEASRSPASSPASPSPDDEYNFNWLDPEKRIYVLQNRRYLKANHAMISGMAGVGFSNPYRSTYVFDGRLAYYFSEAWGIEGFYAYNTNSPNSNFTQLQSTGSTIQPVVREIKGQFGGLVHWAPWYAKINVFNKILYFDWYFSGGAGEIHSTLFNGSGQGTQADQDLFSFYLGTGHLYHVTESFLVRLDFTSSIYRGTVLGDSSWYSNLNFSAGLGFRL